MIHTILLYYNVERQPRVRLTPHCRLRLIEREITEEQVHAVISNPVSIFEDSDRGNFKCYGSVDDAPYADEPFLLIIYETHNNEIVVLTTMWQSRGGLRAIGFNNL